MQTTDFHCIGAWFAKLKYVRNSLQPVTCSLVTNFTNHITDGVEILSNILTQQLQNI